MTLETDTGAKITVPYLAAEITYGQFLDYSRSRERYSKLLRDTDESPDDIPEVSFEEMIIESVQFVATIDGEIPFTLTDEPLSDYDSIPASLDAVSYLRIFKHIERVIRAFNPEHNPDLSDESFAVRYKGDTYRLYSGEADKVVTRKAFTAGEVITIREIERILNPKLSSDTWGNIEFEKELSVLAVLLRKEGEVLPLLPVARRKFIEERGKLFQDIDMATVLSVRFFLTRSFRNSIAQHPLASFFQELLNIESTTDQTKNVKLRKQRSA